MNQVYIHEQLIRFSHCDPAAIVYFPRFFDLAHSTMEDWFAQGVGFSLTELIINRRIGTPTVSIQGDFVRPLRMGDTLKFELSVTKLGNASANLQYFGTKDGMEHLRIAQTLVFMDLDAGRAVPIPADIRSRIETFLTTTDEVTRK